MKIILGIVLICAVFTTQAQVRPFRFALASDLHIGSPNGQAEEDLRRTVRDIVAMDDLAFVLLTGDITEMGTDQEILLAKSILDSLDIPWYIIPGNHDSGWSESGGESFIRIFGSDKFSFTYNGIRFLGCASGPYVRMSDGHIPRDAVNWLDKQLKDISDDHPLIMVNHYPLDNSLDNWYEVTDRIRKKNTWLAICGHGHSNRKLDFEGIPGVMGRSNLRAKAEIGGYNIVSVSEDSVLFAERRPGKRTLPVWNALSTPKTPRATATPPENYPRPSYAINESFPQVKRAWMVADDANIISTPAVGEGIAVVGNQSGKINAFRVEDGKKIWSVAAEGAIYSSPAIHQRRVVVGSGGGTVYCLQLKTGRIIWQWKAKASVLGSPVISGDTVFFGTSDHRIIALQFSSGRPIWQYEGLEGPVVSKPLLYQGMVIVGAWDRHLYAIHSATGNLVWKWNNGTSVRNFSPASCIPVAANGIIYIMAPDRFTTAIEASTGKTLWRTKDGGVRESIGMSTNGEWVYGKSMQDSLVAYRASRDSLGFAWKMHVGFGYEHAPSMLIEKNGLVLFGTRNGVVYAVDPQSRTVKWAHKVDNSMVNTVNVLDSNSVIVSTMDGKLTLLHYE